MHLSGPRSPLNRAIRLLLCLSLLVTVLPPASVLAAPAQPEATHADDTGRLTLPREDSVATSETGTRFHERARPTTPSLSPTQPRVRSFSSPQPRRRTQSVDPLRALPNFVQGTTAPVVESPRDPRMALHPVARKDYGRQQSDSRITSPADPFARHIDIGPDSQGQATTIAAEQRRNNTDVEKTHTVYLPIVARETGARTTIDPETGGQLTSPDGAVTVRFLSGAVEQQATAQFNQNDSLRNLPSSLRFAGRAFEVTVRAGDTEIEYFPPQVAARTTYHDSEFDIDRTAYDITSTVEIALTYDRSAIAGVQERRLRLYRQNSNTGAWTAMPGVVDAQKNQLLTTVERSGRYALLGPVTNSDNTAAISLSATQAVSETQAYVILDPDHGGEDPNGGQVTSPAEFAAWEEEYNLQVAQLVRDQLQACGLEVDMTRDGDYAVAPQTRADMINSAAPDAAATLAFNIVNPYMGDSSVTGSGPEYRVISPNSLQATFGEAIASRVSQYTGLPNRGYRDGSWIYVVANVDNAIPFTHVELAFMDNYTDRAIMDDSEGMAAIANGAFMGIIDQLGGESVCDTDGGFEFPDPLSPEERARLWNLGYQNYKDYDGDPVDMSTGNHLQQFTDFDIPGVAGHDFTLQRTYNSLDDREGVFGAGWSSMLDMSLRLANDGSVDVRYPNGSGVYFVSDGDRYEPGQEGVFATLTRNGPDFMLGTPAQMFYHFTVDGYQGRLTKVEDRHGNTITFERGGDDGHIETIIDSGGREYDVTHDGDYINSITDPAGRTVEYEYDGDGNLVSVTDPRDGVQQFEYDGHLMTTLTDPEGIVYLQNIYDGENRVVEQIDASGNHSYLDYSTAGETHYTDNLGNETIYHHDELSRTTKIVDALGNTETFEYDDDYNLTSHTDKRGNTWTYTYDDRGNLLSETDPLGHVTEYTYNATNDVTSITDEGGPDGTTRTTTFVYDDAGNLVRVERPDGTAIRSTYDDRGQMQTMTDPRGNTTTYDYDDAGNLTRVTDPEGNATERGYDAVGRMTSITDANGHTATFTYDGNDNVIRITDAKNQNTNLSYDSDNRIVKVTDRRDGVTRYEYNDMHQIVAKIDPEGNTTTYDYDAMYNRVSMTDPRGNTTKYRYDDIYRLTDVEDALANVTRFAYDANGNVTEVIDALGQRTTFIYDELNRLTQEADAMGRTTTFTYDAVGRRTSITNPRGATTTYRYDLLDRVTLIRDALGGEWRLTYDAASNLIAAADANGNTIEMRYDAANRMTERVDAGGHATQFDYDGVGNLTAVTDALGRVTRYAYDANDNLSTVTDALGNETTLAYNAEDLVTAITDARDNTTQFTYDLNGMMVSLTEAGGQVTTHEYDAARNLVAVTNAKDNTWTYTYDALNRRVRETDPLGHTTEYTYDAIGRQTHVADANGVTTRYEYDALDRLTAVVQNARAGETSDADTNVTTRYQYDAVGNLTTITDANGHTTTFSYDLLDRLVEEINPLGNTWAYGYDAVGNLTTRTDANGQTTTYNYNADNLLTEIDYPDDSDVSFGYDAVHNQVEMTDGLGLTRNEYDALNRLVASVNHEGQEVSYTYDAVGNRTSMTYPDGRALRYEYDDTNYVSRIIEPDGGIFNISRDATHNITAIDYPNQTNVQYGIDAAERLRAVHNTTDDGKNINTFDYTLDAAGNRTQTVASYSTGQVRTLTTTYDYDPLYRLARSEDSEGRFNEYTFDAVGNRQQLVTNFDPTIDREVETVTTTYSYDAANALIDSVRSAQPHKNGERTAQTTQILEAFVHEVDAQTGVHIEEATADALVNDATALIDDLKNKPAPNESEVAADLEALRTDVETAGDDGRIDNAGIVNSLLVKLRQTGDANRQQAGEVLTTLYEYDRNGNRIERIRPNDMTGNPRDRIKTEYAYDVENRLTQVQEYRDAGNGRWNPRDETVLTYDGYGRLFRRAYNPHIGNEGPQSVDYVYDGLDPIAEYLNPGARSVNYHRGTGRILSAYHGPGGGDGLRTYYHPDGLGSVTALTKHLGQSVHEYRYSDYGTILDDNGHAADASNFTDPHNHYTYTGQEWDEETELFHFHSREYDSYTGTWLQQDIYRGRLERPIAFNRYSYVENNPTSYFDILGLASNEEIREAINDYRTKKSELEDLEKDLSNSAKDMKIPKWVKTENDIDKLIDKWQGLRNLAIRGKEQAKSEANKLSNKILFLDDNYREIVAEYEGLIQEVNTKLTQLQQWRSNFQKVRMVEQKREEVKTAREARNETLEESKNSPNLFAGCTAYVAGRFRVTWSGHAQEWAGNASEQGYEVNSTPKVGSVATWTSGPYGHVAAVTNVDKNDKGEVTSITVKQGQYWKYRNDPTSTTANWGHYYDGYGNLDTVDEEVITDLDDVSYIHPVEE